MELLMFFYRLIYSFSNSLLLMAVGNDDQLM